MAYLKLSVLLLLLSALSASAARAEPPSKSPPPFLVQGGGPVGSAIIVKTGDGPLAAPIPPLVIDEKAKAVAEKYFTVLIDSGKFSILLDLLENYVDTLALVKAVVMAGSATIFAPTDEAFAKIPANIVEGLKKHPDILLDLISYHVVEGAYPAKVLLSRPKTSLTSLYNREKVEVTARKDGVFVGVGAPLAAVVLPDVIVVTDAFVVHEIDYVLYPPKFVVFAAALKKEVVTEKKEDGGY